MTPGMNRYTGSAMDAGLLDHLKQSVTDILTTPIGSRVMRREYGSRLFALVDAPGNRNSLLRAYMAVAEALERWEPRLRLTRVQIVEVSAEGRFGLALDAVYAPTGKPIVLEGIVV